MDSVRRHVPSPGNVPVSRGTLLHTGCELPLRLHSLHEGLRREIVGVVSAEQLAVELDLLVDP